MSASMFSVLVEGPGELWIMPCPGAATLRDDIANYSAAGATHIVSMLTQDEAQQLGLEYEATKCRAAGIEFHAHPIVDFGLPEMSGFTALTGQVADWIMQGNHVAVHCRAGIGRSGMVTAGVLISMGLTAKEAIDEVSRARGVSIPDTVEQGSFLTTFAERLKAKS